jgi:hypothetical protein|tara:strand:- start:275 stop:562 length:288 start_codon:yes stop_codon:yes gene_type:complete
MSISVDEAIAWADKKREELEGCGLSDGQVYILRQVYEMSKGQYFSIRNFKEEPTSAINYHLDLVIAEKLNITVDELDALPLSEVEKLRVEEMLNG